MLTLFEVPTITFNSINPEFMLRDKMLQPVKGHKRVNDQLLSAIKVTVQNEYSADKLIKEEFDQAFQDALTDTIKFSLINESLPTEKQDKEK